MKRRNALLILAMLALIAVPLFVVRKPAGDGEVFAGADDRATDAIKDLSPGYKPWFSPVFEPPSGEIETMLFALQAALGAGVIGYYLGLSKGRAARKGGLTGDPCI
jgi:cobalt/nickel transport protein